MCACKTASHRWGCGSYHLQGSLRPLCRSFGHLFATDCVFIEYWWHLRCFSVQSKSSSVTIIRQVASLAAEIRWWISQGIAFFLATLNYNFGLNQFSSFIMDDVCTSVDWIVLICWPSRLLIWCPNIFMNSIYLFIGPIFRINWEQQIANGTSPSTRRCCFA